MSVTITSTTDSSDDVLAATGKKAAPKTVAEKQPSVSEAPEPQDEKEVQEPSDAQANENEAEVSDDEGDESESKEQPKKKGGYQKKIDKLTRQRAEAEREVEYWRTEALKHKSPREETVETPKDHSPVAPSDEPKEEHFESHKDYMRALHKWDRAQEEAAKEQQRREEELKKIFAEQIQKHTERVNEFASKTEDFRELIEDLDDVQMSLTVRDVILGSDNGPELMYELAKNKSEYARICALPAIQAARELGKIEARLHKQEPVKEQPKITKAPPPIKPVSARSSAASTKSPDEMSLAEYKAWRRANS